MADRLVVMHEGRVQQIGTPEELHERPANPFVARFIGGSNIVAGRLDGERRLMLAGGAHDRAGRPLRGAAAMQRWRCGRTASASAHPAAAACIEGEVELCTWLGSGGGACRCGSPPTSRIAGARPGPWRDATRAPQCRHARRAALGARRTNGCSMQDGRAMPMTATDRSSGRPIMPDLNRARAAPCSAARRCWPRPRSSVRRAPAEQCVVGTWGGDYARLLRENIDDPILKPAGINVVQDVGDEAPRFAKLYAQKKLPRGAHGHRLRRRAERLPRRRCRPGREPRPSRRCRT